MQDDLDKRFIPIQALYCHYTRVRTEVRTIIELYSMIPVILPHPHHSAQFITLVGTIEITFRCRNFNIPLLVMFPYDYPFSPPLFFTDPSPTMLIVPGHPFARPDRSITHPTLYDWTQTNNSLFILTTLQHEFSIFPPLQTRRPVRPPPFLPAPFSPQQPPRPIHRTKPSPHLSARGARRITLIELEKMLINNDITPDDFVALYAESRQPSAPL